MASGLIYIWLIKRRISAQEKAKSVANWRCFNCGGCNHSVVECTVRIMTQRSMVAGVEVKERGTRAGSDESGIN